MRALISFLDPVLAQSLAWTLLHFVWQGGALALLFAIVARYGRLSASARYVAGVVTLVAMLGAPLMTFAVLDSPAGPAPIASIGDDAALAALDGLAVDPASLQRPTDPASISSISTAIVIVWSIGVVVLAARMTGGWILARRLVHRAVAPVGPEIQTIAARVADRLSLDRIVKVAQSSTLAVPVMIGWLKPVVLLPAGILSGLTPQQIEALLAHEFAHIRRHDYIVNLLQTIVETLLFYHPAVWWVSKRVRVEREHCCDDLAVAICDRLVYATALSELAALSAPPGIALAATSGSLLHRVRRILAASGEPQDSGSGWVPALGLAVIVGVAVPVLLVSARPAETPAAQTLPAKVREVLPEARSEPATEVASPGESAIEVSPENAAAQDQLARELERLAAQKLIVSDKELKLEQARSALEMARAEANAQSQIKMLETRLDAERQMYERTKRQAELGLISPTALVELRANMTLLEEQIAAARRDLTFALQDLELRRREIHERGELDRLTVDVERQLRESRSERLKVAERDALGALDRKIRAELMLHNTVEAGADEPIRSGDMLLIEISGEPDVPRAYVVHADGTIKLPLSAPLRVEGSTARQVQQDLVKQLLSRGLPNPSAEVIVRRPRGPEGQLP